MDDDTVYSSSPGETAKRWASEGAERIHIVDLDGAFSGKPENMEAIRAIRRAVDIELDLGGGIRDEATATRLLEEGLDFVILGTAALESPELVGKLSDRFPGKVLVGIDANDGMVAVRGWADVSKTPAVDLAADLSDRGAAGFIFTDIARDGMQTGVNVEATAAFARAARGEVIASGGLNDIEGVRELLKFEGDGITGVITGRAIYEGTLDLAEAIALTKGAVG